MDKLYSKGFSFVETLVVIAVIGLLASVTFVRLSSMKNNTNLWSAAESLQQALNDIKEKAGNPNYSGNPSQTMDVNGYGLYFSGPTSFFTYQDAKDSAHPEYERRWVPETNDTVVASYNFDDMGISSIAIYALKRNNDPWNYDVAGNDLFISYSENATGATPYYKSSGQSPVDIRELKIVIRLTDGGDRVGIDYTGIGNIHKTEICNSSDTSCNIWVTGIDGP